MKEYKYFRLIKNKITQDMLNQIVAIEQADGDGYSEEIIKEIYVKNKKNVIYACFDEDKIVGHIAVNPKSSVRDGNIYIINLVVSPEYRRQGIASELIYKTCRHFLEKDKNGVISLEVDKENIGAIGLYRKLGFEIKQSDCYEEEFSTQYQMNSSVENVCLNIEISRIYDEPEKEGE